LYWKPRNRPEDCSHIFDNGDGRLSVALLLATSLLWSNAKKRLLGLGFVLHQDGDTEGVLTFDPANPAQVKAALKAAGIHPMKDFSPETRAKYAEHMRRVRYQQPTIFE
jgi:hypothetical protein